MLLLNMLTTKYYISIFLAIFTFINVSYAKEENYNIWLSELRKEAIEKGISEKTFDKTMESVVILDKVKKLDKKQPERTITFIDYYKRTVNSNRIKVGKEKFDLHKKEINEIAEKYGVQARFILSIWGIETNYGTYTGSFSVISSLTSLAFNGRRAKFFRNQLLDALEILDKGYIELKDMKGSWAGAMGQSQFMPSSYLEYAQDYDKDGKKDIWNNYLDVFSSIAFYLKSHGWDNNKTWGREVLVPKNILISYKENYTDKKALKFWSKIGIKKYNGDALPNINLTANLILPDGPEGKAFLVYDNFYTIKKYNASTYYALSIGILSDRIKF
ncbi:MAG: Membrane-bound lytic murein transglycosylase B [Alphaproteobacteria bacterium MarineAlpha9_Bin3]|nr:MAG: Membrane-bound lytic murein transglycosylase B [Alphaproteobacteria bacterium MarineAlpha9_Bin3]|tara:strand:- start:804 stop:1793 length:990 start_codon:yes stop_codon:yes gene_type:complete